MRIFIRALPIVIYLFVFFIPNAYIRLSWILFASFLTFKGGDMLIDWYENNQSNDKK
ncbi:hypothetical protein [Holzapfeliella sp. JNUCC 72]